MVVEDFNAPLSLTDKSPKQKINKERLELNHTIDQMDLTGIYRIFIPTSTQYTFFSAVHRTFSKLDYNLGHKTSLSKYNPMHSI
jgi:hypothetical protein